MFDMSLQGNRGKIKLKCIAKLYYLFPFNSFKANKVVLWGDLNIACEHRKQVIFFADLVLKGADSRGFQSDPEFTT